MTMPFRSCIPFPSKNDPRRKQAEKALREADDFMYSLLKQNRSLAKIKTCVVIFAAVGLLFVTLVALMSRS